MSTMHAVLVGIDDYRKGPSPLSGCVNDIDQVQRVLTQRLGVPPEQVTRLAAPRDGRGEKSSGPSRSPTRKAIFDVLAGLGTDAVKEGDRVLFYYSGHGASVPVRRGSTGDRAPRVLREALVPVDAYFDAKVPRNLLYDVQLNALLRQIATRTRRLTGIFDCCHSQGVTRAAEYHAPGDVPRYLPVSGVSGADDGTGAFGAEELGLSAVDLQEEEPARGVAGAGDVLFALARSIEDCAVAAACLADESAMEGRQPDGQPGGYFTNALVHAWDTVPADELSELRWGRVWRQVVADVQRREAQHPRLMASYARMVFGGLPEAGDTGFGVCRTNGSYALDVGQLGGVTEGARVAVYGSEPAVLPPIGSVAERAARLGTLIVKHAAQDRADSVPAEGSPTAFTLPLGARARVIDPGREAQLVVAIAPPDPDLQSRIESRRSPFLRFAEPGEQAVAILQRCKKDGSWAIADDWHGPGDVPGEAYLARVPADSDASVLTRLLEHYHSYIAPVQMASRCEDAAGVLQIGLLNCNDVTYDGCYVVDPRIECLADPDPAAMPPIAPTVPKVYDLRVGADSFCYELRSRHSRTLYVTLVESGSDGSVSLLGGGQVAVPPDGRYVIWFDGDLGRPTVFSLSDEKKTIGIDRVVAIGTTAKDKTLDFLKTDTTFEDAAKGLFFKKAAPYGGIGTVWTSDRVVIRGRRTH